MHRRLHSYTHSHVTVGGFDSGFLEQSGHLFCCNRSRELLKRWLIYFWRKLLQRYQATKHFTNYRWSQCCRIVAIIVRYRYLQYLTNNQFFDCLPQYPAVRVPSDGSCAARLYAKRFCHLYAKWGAARPPSPHSVRLILPFLKIVISRNSADAPVLHLFIYENMPATANHNSIQHIYY